MSGVFSGVAQGARHIAASGIWGKVNNVLTMGASGYVQRRRNYTDTDILEGNPTTPLSKSDTATKIADPLNLTGEPGRDAARNAAAAAAAAVKPPQAIPDIEEILRVRRLAAARSRSRSGRASTIFGDSGDYSSGDALGG